MRPIPWTFICSRTRLSWGEVALGYHNHWLIWSDVIEMACDSLLDGEEATAVVELAGLSKSDVSMVGELLDRLANNSTDEDNIEAKAKWLYLQLAWLFENRLTIDDPLGEVEKIYADFDYPEDVASFVRYMPASDEYDPSMHSADENLLRLMTKWEGYLERCAIIFAVPSQTALKP